MPTMDLEELVKNPNLTRAKTTKGSYSVSSSAYEQDNIISSDIVEYTGSEPNSIMEEKTVNLPLNEDPIIKHNKKTFLMKKSDLVKKSVQSQKRIADAEKIRRKVKKVKNYFENNEGIHVLVEHESHLSECEVAPGASTQEMIYKGGNSGCCK